MNQLELKDKEWERDWKTIVNIFDTIEPVSYTHLTLPTTPYV